MESECLFGGGGVVVLLANIRSHTWGHDDMGA